MKYIAQIEVGNQITEDHYQVLHPTIELNEDTTIKEIFIKFKGWKFSEINIIELNH
jgi:hypothetical protein